VIVNKITENAPVSEDNILTAVLDAGAQEVNDLGESFEIVSEASDVVAVRTALQSVGIDYESAEATFMPSMTVPLDEDAAKTLFRLLETLEDSDDVQNVYANFDISDEIMEKVSF
jgi:transcriptional/translational regulatory protein YebC/TACO1